MGYRNREIERKFIVAGTDLLTTAEAIKTLLGKDVTDTIIDSSKDKFWSPPDIIPADFIRLRYMPNGGAQLTVKHSDKGSTLNRVERDVTIPNPEEAEKFLNYIFGESVGGIYKTYHVYFLDNEHTTVSVYKVRADERVFVEIEATSVAKLEAIQKVIEGTVKMDVVPFSLFDLILKGKK